MKTTHIDYLNIGLIIVSCSLAFLLPFELFLFSYAVLGPLHYLTEIGWLHRRDYFTTAKYDYLYLVGLLLVMVLASFIDQLQSLKPALTMSAFLGALALILIREWRIKILFLLIIVFLDLLLYHDLFYLSVFLPTIIHVYFFTGAFMLYGALKSRSLPGLLSVVVLIAAAALCFFVPPSQWGSTSEYVRESYSAFEPIHFSLASILGFESLTISNDIYGTRFGVMIMRFIAFAYTYHYLNWFSKTSVIQWHKAPVRVVLATIFLWIVSVSIYLYSYRLGIAALGFLSLLHVYLEFPLNYRSFVGIGIEMRDIARSRSFAAGHKRRTA